MTVNHLNLHQSMTIKHLIVNHPRHEWSSSCTDRILYSGTCNLLLTKHGGACQLHQTRSSEVFLTLLSYCYTYQCLSFQLCYSEALKQADAKKQKVILRIIKRLVGGLCGVGGVHCWINFGYLVTFKNKSYLS